MTSLVFGAVCLSAGAGHILDGSPPIGIASLLAAVAFGGLLAVFRYTGSVSLAGHGLVVIVFSVIVFGIVTEGGSHSAFQPVIGITPVLALILLGYRGSIVWFGLVVVSLVGVGLAESVFGRLPAPAWRESSLIMPVVGPTLFMALLYGTGLAYEYLRRSSLAEVWSSEAHLASLMAVFPDMIFKVDDVGVIIDFRVPERISITDHMPPGTRIDQLFPELGSDILRDLSKIAGSAEPQGNWTYDHRIQFGSELRDFEARVLVQSESTFVIILRDVTRRTRAERRVREEERRRFRTEADAKVARASRLAELGRLVETVAHEINNPLMSVTGNLTLIEDAEVIDDPDLVEALTDARSGAERIRNIISDVRAYSRVEDTVRSSRIDLNDTVERCLSLVNNGLRHRARLVKDFGSVRNLLSDPAGLSQVFLNLLTNAIQAIPDEPTADGVITVKTEELADGRVIIEVSDNGSGMSPDVQRRAFEPFFTTRPIGTGTGLGLFMCHGIIKKLGGHIEVETAEGEGTTVRVVLPHKSTPEACTGVQQTAAAGSTRQSGVPTALEPPSDLSPRILVIDDDAVAAKGMRRMLRGYRVTEETDSHRALTLLTNDTNWDLVLCDITMPNMNGIELYRRLKILEPNLADRIVFMAEAFDPHADTFLRSVDNTSFKKPINREALRALVAARIGD